jgi:hypothetical protein
LEQSEVETLVEELEVRVERLRALYDQYFMGIEKLEPAVPRKDVERRLYVLRRTQIRNTSLRFRFQNVLLRYNTYQTYWMRICRQIEEGTYKRDVRRANARFSVRRKEEAPSTRRSEVHDTEPPAPDDAFDEIDVEFEAEDELKPESLLEDLQMRAILRPGAVPRDLSPQSTTRVDAVRPGRSGHNPLEIPTEREIWIAPPVARKSTPVQGRRSSRPAPPHPTAIAAPRSQPIQPGARYVQAGKGAVAAPARPAGAEPPVGPARPTRPEAPTPAQAAHPLAPRIPPVPLPPPTARGGGPSQVPGRKSSSPPKKKSRPSMPKVQAPRPGPGPSAPVPAPKGGLSEERVRQIYTQYVDTKRSLKESTASITYESLSRSLRDSSDKLREKHRGRSVDFEVTVKDGKTILRPVVK